MPAKALSIGLTIAAIATVAFLAGRRSGEGDVAQRLAAMEANQRALQDAFLNDSADSRRQLASRLGYRVVPAAPQRADGVSDPSRAPAPVEARQKAQDAYDDLQRAFAAEPVDAAWGGTVRQNVQDLLQGVVKEGAPAPRAVQVDCRSRTCEISLGLAENGNPDMLMEPLLSEIAGDLPNATMVQLPSADGRGTVLHVFASKPRP